MWRQAVVLLLGTAALLTVGHRLHSEAREAGAIAWSSQVLIGALCAFIAALVVVTANADGIPDEIEAPLAVVAVLVVVGLTFTTFRPTPPPSSRRRPRPGRVGAGGQFRAAPPTSSRRPDASRDPTSRMHNGP